MPTDLIFPSIGKIEAEMRVANSKNVSKVAIQSPLKPGDWILAIYLGRGNRRLLSSLRWGFDPDHQRLQTLRLETASKKAVWKHAFTYNRCIIPLVSFRMGKHTIVGDGKNIIPLAAVMSFQGEVAALVTVPSCGKLSEFGNRMLSVVPEEHIDTWLDPTNASPDDLKPILYESCPDLPVRILEDDLVGPWLGERLGA